MPSHAGGAKKAQADEQPASASSNAFSRVSSSGKVGAVAAKKFTTGLESRKTKSELNDDH